MHRKTFPECSHTSVAPLRPLTVHATRAPRPQLASVPPPPLSLSLSLSLSMRGVSQKSIEWPDTCFTLYYSRLAPSLAQSGALDPHARLFLAAPPPPTIRSIGTSRRQRRLSIRRKSCRANFLAPSAGRAGRRRDATCTLVRQSGVCRQLNHRARYSQRRKKERSVADNWA